MKLHIGRFVKDAPSIYPAGEEGLSRWNTVKSVKSVAKRNAIRIWVAFDKQDTLRIYWQTMNDAVDCKSYVPTSHFNAVLIHRGADFTF